MDLLYILLVLLFVTRTFGELAERIGQPALMGELVSGILLGLLVQQYADVMPALAHLPDNEVFTALTDLAIFFLMLQAGIEMHPRDLARASGTAAIVALGGMLLPLAAGLAIGYAFIPESEARVAQILFIATALAITAVPVAVRVLMDLHRLNTRMGQLIVSAAIVDDVLSLILLAVLTVVIATGTLPGAGEMGMLVVQVVAFFLVTGLIGHYWFPLGGRLLKSLRTEEIDFSGLLIAALAFAVLAEALGMHFILGAFVAGLFFVGRTVDIDVYRSIKARLSGITEGFLAPLFFASIGLHLDLGAAVHIPAFVVAITAAAFLCKLIGAGLPAYWAGFGAREATGVGIGMSARGAVELIIADIAFRAGLFSMPQPAPPVVEHMFSAVVIMALLTTLATPILLRHTVGSD